MLACGPQQFITSQRRRTIKRLFSLALVMNSPQNKARYFRADKDTEEKREASDSENQMRFATQNPQDWTFSRAVSSLLSRFRQHRSRDIQTFREGARRIFRQLSASSTMINSFYGDIGRIRSEADSIPLPHVHASRG